jgi:hypothetical protein
MSDADPSTSKTIRLSCVADARVGRDESTHSAAENASRPVALATEVPWWQTHNHDRSRERSVPAAEPRSGGSPGVHDRKITLAIDTPIPVSDSEIQLVIGMLRAEIAVLFLEDE